MRGDSPGRASHRLSLTFNDEDYAAFSRKPIGELLLESRHIRLIVFDPHTEAIRLWIPQNPIAS